MSLACYNERAFVMGRKQERLNASSIWAEDPFEIKLIGAADKDNFLFAQMLQDLDRFYTDIASIRKLLHLEKALRYPVPPTIENLFAIKDSLTPLQRKILDIEIQKLIKAIGLTPGWELSLEVLILTHVLPLLGTSPFILFNPQDGIPLPFYRQPHMPLIILQYAFSPEALIKWIERNREKVKELGEKLPKLHKRGNKDKALFVQRAIFLLREYEGKDSQYIGEQLLPKICRKAGIDDPGYDYMEVDKQYSRYKNYLKSIYK